MVCVCELVYAQKPNHKNAAHIVSSTDILTEKEFIGCGCLLPKFFATIFIIFKSEHSHNVAT
jgi:hypothetical protein